MRFMHECGRNRFYNPFSKQILQESVFQFESDSHNKIVVEIEFC